MLVEKLHDLIAITIKSNLDKIEGEICLPISGGLDSRIVAGFMKKFKRPIDLVITYGRKNDRQVKYARDIAIAAGYTKNIVIVSYSQPEIMQFRDAVQKLNGLADMSTPNFVALTKINKQIDLKRYTVLIPYMIDVMTGIKINPITLLKGREYFQKYDDFMINKYYQNICEKGLIVYKHFFQDAINPVWKNDRLIEFCLSLPLRYRFHQYLYRQMLKKYFPELAAIPRAYMDCRMDCNELTYFIYRTNYYFKKIYHEKTHQNQY